MPAGGRESLVCTVGIRWRRVERVRSEPRLRRDRPLVAGYGLRSDTAIRCGRPNCRRTRVRGPPELDAAFACWGIHHGGFFSFDDEPPAPGQARTTGNAHGIRRGFYLERRESVGDRRRTRGLHGRGRDDTRRPADSGGGRCRSRRHHDWAARFPFGVDRKLHWPCFVQGRLCSE